LSAAITAGGIRGLDEHNSDDRQIPIWLINARKAVTRVERKPGASIPQIDPEACHRLIVDENVRLQLEHLQDYPFVAAAMKTGRLRLHGWVYDMGCGEIDIISGSENLNVSVRPSAAARVSTPNRPLNLGCSPNRPFNRCH
jgi:carbonic anhydrase